MADAALAALYQEMILDHYRRPRNKGTLEHATVSVPMKNPLCGDEVTLEVLVEHGDIAAIAFTGHGCSISQASTSMMTELIKGMSTDDVAHIGERFRAMILGDATAAGDESLGRTRALSGVARFPARVKCALLGWNALDQALARARAQG